MNEFAGFGTIDDHIFEARLAHPNEVRHDLCHCGKPQDEHRFRNDYGYRLMARWPGRDSMMRQQAVLVAALRVMAEEPFVNGNDMAKVALEKAERICPLP